jgi:hypothetical protein
LLSCEQAEMKIGRRRFSPRLLVCGKVCFRPSPRRAELDRVRPEQDAGLGSNSAFGLFHLSLLTTLPMSMAELLRLVLMRVMQGAAILLVLSFLLFGMMSKLPGDPVDLLVASMRAKCAPPPRRGPAGHGAAGSRSSAGPCSRPLQLAAPRAAYIPVRDESNRRLDVYSLLRRQPAVRTLIHSSQTSTVWAAGQGKGQGATKPRRVVWSKNNPLPSLIQDKRF